jgi:iron complex transport system permease protein
MLVIEKVAAWTGHGIKKIGGPSIVLFAIAGGLGILVMSMLLSLSYGIVQVPFTAVWDALVDFNPDSIQHLIIRDLRLPRTLASILVGASLAVAGAVMQGITRNPMADSGLMGLNAGAGFALSLCFTFFPGIAAVYIMLSSFLGAAIAAGMVYWIASLRCGGATSMRLVLAGAAVSALLTALGQGIAIYFGVARDIMFWLTGGVAGVTWQQLHFLYPWVGMALLLALLLSRSVSLLSLGSEVSQGLGLRIRFVNLLAVIAILILAGVSVAVAGPIGFVGLIIPHMSRYLFGVDYRVIIPSSAILGSLLLVLADLGARTINPDFETPVGALTALIGVPFFLYLARQRRAI